MGRGDVFWGRQTYVSRETFSADEILKQNLLGQETLGCVPIISPHQPFDALRAALSLPLLDGHNRGFYRSEASLAVIFLAERDAVQEGLSVAGVQDFLTNLKAGDGKKVALHGAIIEKNDPLNCLGQRARTTGRIEEAIALFLGLSFNLCTPSFGEELGKIGRDLNRRFGEVFIPLDYIPAEGTISVEYKGRLLSESGWTYDPNRKGIRLSEDVSLPSLDMANGELIVSFFPSAKKP